jgi:hypothetical protein
MIRGCPATLVGAGLLWYHCIPLVRVPGRSKAGGVHPSAVRSNGLIWVNVLSVRLGARLRSATRQLPIARRREDPVKVLFSKSTLPRLAAAGHTFLFIFYYFF